MYRWPNNRPLVLSALGLLILVGIGGWFFAPNTSSPIGKYPVGAGNKNVVGGVAKSTRPTGESKAGTANTSPGFLEKAQQLRSIVSATDDSVAAWHRLVDEWVAINPIELLSFLESIVATDPFANTLLERAMKAWLSRDPVNAMAYAKQAILNEPSKQLWYLAPLMRAIATRDGMEEAVQLVRTLPQNDLLYQNAIPVLASFMRANTAGARSMIDSLPNDAVKPQLHEMFGAMDATMHGWEALDELAQNPSSKPYLADELTGLITGLYRRDAEKLLGWIESQAPSADLDIARQRIVQQEATTDPERGLKIALSIQTEQIKNEALKSALTQWFVKDRSKAEAWAIQSDVSPQIVAEVMTTTQDVPEQYFENKMAAARIMTDPIAQEKTQVLYYYAWVNTDPDAAYAWLATSNLSGGVKDMLSKQKGAISK